MRRSLRLEQSTYDAIQEIAAAEQRSVNAQIERFLREAVERWNRQQGAGDPPAPAAPTR